MKIFIMMIALYLAFLTTTAFAESCDDKKKRITEAEYSNCLKKESAFLKWAEPINNRDLNKRKDAYIMRKHMIMCTNRESFIEIFNTIQGQGGNYNPNTISRRTNSKCIALQKATFGRIVKRVKGSNVVNVEYQPPYEKTVSEAWTHEGLLQPMQDFLNSLAK